jgi:hypothetical protein
VTQLRYVITFLDCKLTAHRWDSVPKGKFARPHPLETPSDDFSNTSCTCLISQASIAFEIGDHPLIATINASLNAPYSSRLIDWDLIVQGLSFYPAQFIVLAAAIGGFSRGWFCWRRRNESIGDDLPYINPAQFAVTAVAILIAVVTAAPILAAVSFSYWWLVL